MKPTEIFPLLSRLESALGDFSFNELGFEDASRLRTSFQAFKADLEEKIPGNFKTNSTTFESTRRTGHAETHETGLIANVSHEIRTPLNGIIGFTDLLRDSALDENQSIQVNAIQSASYSLLEIVNELLEYSKLAAGREEFQQIEFNLFRLVRDSIYMCNTLIINEKITLTSSIGKGVPEILVGDPSKLTQVLLNLIGNAIKFVGDGEVHLHITLVKVVENGYLLRFQIVDNGIGIAREKIDRIFDPFTQVHPQAQLKDKGTGLGLSIVKQIIDKMGGQISADSELNVGTTITFTMPFGFADQTEDPKKSFQEHHEGDRMEQVAGLKILVFEDNALNQRLIAQRLEAWECETHITDDGPHGLKILDKYAIDVVLMDLRMPKMNGYEIAERIRNSASLRIKQIPIIALTADYSIRDKEKCHSYGINDYLLKPFSPVELLKKLISSQRNDDRPGQSLSRSPNRVLEQKSLDRPLDLTTLLSQCGTDTNVVLELIVLFKQNINEFLRNTQVHLNNKDVKGLRFSCHKIKAGLVMLKANSLLDIIEEINNGCRVDIDWMYLEYQFVRFSKTYPEVEKALDMAAKELKEG